MVRRRRLVRERATLTVGVVLLMSLSACTTENLDAGASRASTSASRPDPTPTTRDDENCDGSGCSDSGEFIGGATPGDISRSAEAAASAEAQPNAASEFVLVPDLVGLSPDDAKLVTEDYGLRLANGSVGPYGIVTSQTPRAGSQAPLGSSILISVSG